jgi:hypothetical protein
MTRAKDLNRLPPLDPKSATGKVKQTFDAMQVEFGIVPNLFRVLGNAPAALEAYLNFRAALAVGILNSKVQEQNRPYGRVQQFVRLLLKCTYVYRQQSRTQPGGARGCHPS